MESFTPEKHKAIQNHENKLLVLLAMEEKYANNYYKEKTKLCSEWKELSVSVKKKKIATYLYQNMTQCAASNLH